MLLKDHKTLSGAGYRQVSSLARNFCLLFVLNFACIELMCKISSLPKIQLLNSKFVMYFKLLPAKIEVFNYKLYNKDLTMWLKRNPRNILKRFLLWKMWFPNFITSAFLPNDFFNWRNMWSNLYAITHSKRFSLKMSKIFVLCIFRDCLLSLSLSLIWPVGMKFDLLEGP